MKSSNQCNPWFRQLLPGVAIFTQPDSIVPDPKNPQALNRFSYVYNNPLVYVDPTGHDPSQWDPNWVTAYTAAHGGTDPSEQDWLDYQFSSQHPGTGAGGSWTQSDWLTLTALRDLLGPELLSQIGQRGGIGTGIYSAIGYAQLGLIASDPSLGKQAGPDGTLLILGPAGEPVGPGIGAITFGNVIILPADRVNELSLLNHEYTHVLQYRHLGIGFGPEYAGGGFYNWADNPLEQQGVAVGEIYRQNHWLPPLWQFTWVGWRP